jgi:hypothetical protein
MVPATRDEQYAGSIYGQRFLLLQRQIAAGMDTSADASYRSRAPYFHFSAPGCIKNGAAVFPYSPIGGNRACNE